MKKKSWALLWIGFIIIGIIYLFIYSGLVGAILGFGYRAFRAMQYHLKENTALTLLIIGYIIYNELRRWSK